MAAGGSEPAATAGGAPGGRSAERNRPAAAPAAGGGSGRPAKKVSIRVSAWDGLLVEAEVGRAAGCSATCDPWAPRAPLTHTACPPLSRPHPAGACRPGSHQRGRGVERRGGRAQPAPGAGARGRRRRGQAVGGRRPAWGGGVKISQLGTGRSSLPDVAQGTSHAHPCLALTPVSRPAGSRSAATRAPPASAPPRRHAWRRCPRPRPAAAPSSPRWTLATRRAGTRRRPRPRSAPRSARSARRLPRRRRLSAASSAARITTRRTRRTARWVGAGGMSRGEGFRVFAVA